MIVDDAPTARMILRRHLEAAGCDIIAEADCPADADDRIRVANPDLITLDILMPELRGMDSYTLFHKLRRERPRVELVVISGANYPRNRKNFLKGGALGYYAKPIDFRLLIGDLRAIFPELAGYRVPPAELSFDSAKII